MIIFVLQAANMLQHYFKPSLHREDDILNELETYSLYVCTFVLLGGIAMTGSVKGHEHIYVERENVDSPTNLRVILSSIDLM